MPDLSSLRRRRHALPLRPSPWRAWCSAGALLGLSACVSTPGAPPAAGGGGTLAAAATPTGAASAV
ncbi:MAG: hypothetical protein HY856_00320, partial [Burkholderiales bacterium]|nr:hypothetical protein [Burkholderiales bacterium]